MNKAAARRMKAGTRVICADGPNPGCANVAYVGNVVRVTPKGGVLVRITEGKSIAYSWCGEGTGPGVGTEIWFPYHHVHKQS